MAIFGATRHGTVWFTDFFGGLSGEIGGTKYQSEKMIAVTIFIHLFDVEKKVLCSLLLFLENIFWPSANYSTKSHTLKKSFFWAEKGVFLFGPLKLFKWKEFNLGFW